MSEWMKVTKISSTPEAEQVIEHAYLQCRNVYDDIPEAHPKKELHKRIEDIMKRGHFSVLEHASATFSIRGVSRSFTHQLVRHRLSSFSQVSMRAVPREKFHLIIPPEIEQNELFKATFQQIAGLAASLYENLVQEGIAMEDARFILPIGTETQILMTCNFRQWLHVLKVRLHPDAQWEIKAVMGEIWKQLIDIAPNVFNPMFRRYWE